MLGLGTHLLYNERIISGGIFPASVYLVSIKVINHLYSYITTCLFLTALHYLLPLLIGDSQNSLHIILLVLQRPLCIH